MASKALGSDVDEFSPEDSDPEAAVSAPPMIKREKSASQSEIDALLNTLVLNPDNNR